MGSRWSKIVIVFLLVVLIAAQLGACSTQKSRVQRIAEHNITPQHSGTPGGAHTTETKYRPQWEKTADDIISDGMRYLGTPYVYGTERFSDKAFDCSSYVQYLYAKHGIRLGFNSREQAVEGQEVPFINLRKGDLMFFSDEDYPNETGLNKVRHVGIYMGDGKILHTYEPGIGVVISNIHKDEKEGEYWYQNFLFARRVIPG